jgi:hypothetical protein
MSWLFRPKRTVIIACNQDVPTQIARDVGSLLSELCASGWTISFSRYDPKIFGNWYVDLCRGDDTIQLVKDRSQYLLNGPSWKELESAGLAKAFDEGDKFQRAVVDWAASRFIAKKPTTEPDSNPKSRPHEPYS